MMRYENTNTSLTVRDGAPIAVDGTKAGGVLWHVVASQGADETVEVSSRVLDRAKVNVPHKFVEKVCNLGELVHEGRRADLILAGRVGQLQSLRDVRRASSEQADTSWRARFAFQPGLQGAAHSLHSTLSKRSAAFDPAPLARGGRKPRQSKQGLVV
jgi:hypothetical protein